MVLFLDEEREGGTGSGMSSRRRLFCKSQQTLAKNKENLNISSLTEKN